MQQNQINRSWSLDSLFYLCKVHPYARTKLLFAEELGYFHTFAPYHTERVYKSSYLLLTTVRGKGNLFYENDYYVLEEGDTFLIDCRKYHKYWSDYGVDWSFYWAHINGMPMFSYDDLLKKGTIITNNGQSLLHFWEILMESEQNSEEVLQKNMKQHRVLHQLLSELLYMQVSFIERYGIIPNDLAEILLFYEENLAQPIKLEDMEQRLNISKYTIGKYFKSYLQTTPHQYLTNLRLQRAKKLLIETNLSVNEIAYRVGIPHISHFINLFKRYNNGITPVHYRRLYYHNMKT